MLRLLVERGANIDLISDNGATALSLAIDAGSVTGDELVAELLKLGAKLLGAKMIISMKDFALTGKFGPVRIGMSKDDVIGLLGRPTGEAKLNAGHVDVQYGNYEFFFDKGHILYAIQNDRCNPKNPESVEYKNKRFKIDPWVLRTPRAHTLTRVGGQLEREGIPHSLIDYFGRTAIQFPSKVVLDFSEEGDDPPITAICFFPVPIDEELRAEAISQLEKTISLLKKLEKGAPIKIKVQAYSPQHPKSSRAKRTKGARRSKREPSN
jgi:hypothetical protein